jgi:general secretion pathway protein K
MNPRAASSGAILVTVLWSLALLSALGMAASTTFRGFAGIVAVERDRVRTQALLTSGLEIAAGMVRRLGEDPLVQQQGEVRLPAGLVALQLSDEGGRIDIAKAPPEVLASLFRYVGAPNADAVTERVVAWRKPANGSDEPTSQQETLFASLRGLQQAAGVAPDAVAALAPLATVFGNAAVNPLTAPAEVLAALPGVDRRAIGGFLTARSRAGADPARLSALLGPAGRYLQAGTLRAVSVRLVATLPDGYAESAHAMIVVLPDDTEPYRLLAWDAVTSPGDDRR